MYAEGFHPKEVDFMVVDNHPTLLNVTLHPSKVGATQPPHLWQPPWLGLIKHQEVSKVSGESETDHSLITLAFSYFSKAKTLAPIFTLEYYCLFFIFVEIFR